MTAYSTSALDKLVTDITSKVIQRSMLDAGWLGSWEEEFYADGWQQDIPGKGYQGGPIVLEFNLTTGSMFTSDAPPGSRWLGRTERGENSYERYEFDPAIFYDSWASRVEGLFDKWRDLPDSKPFGDVKIALKLAADELIEGEGFNRVETVKAIGALEGLRENHDAGFVHYFLTNYGADAVRAVMANQGQIAAGLGLAAAGEERLWELARDDIMQMGEMAVKALDVNGGGNGGQTLIAVADAFLSLLGKFGGKAVSMVANAASSFLNLVIPEPKSEPEWAEMPQDTADAMMISLENVVGKLETAIYEEEMEIWNRLNTLWDVVNGNDAQGYSAENFHIHPEAGLDVQMLESPMIAIDPIVVRDIGLVQVPQLATAFFRAADWASSVSGEGVWTRVGSLGLGATGPWPMWKKVLDVLDVVATGSGAELVEAGEALAAAAGLVEDADEQAAVVADKYQDELARGQTSWAQESMA